MTLDLHAQQHVRVEAKGNRDLLLPWTGGLNSCQFGEMDIDLDGTKDLIVFDRMGDRLIPFLRKKIADKVELIYAPQYIASFPRIVDWVQLKDYNGDGKNDIFCYSPSWAGMKVFKNTSKDDLSFEAVASPYLKSLQGGGEVNILVTNADYPGIVDIDGDGDLDIFTFWGLGSFVELHKNLSVETYGHTDSLKYEKVQTCWGHFAESDESNQVYLDSCNCKQASLDRRSDYRHTGSTFFIKDISGDGVMDLVLGDVDYPGLIYLENGGTSLDAIMIKQHDRFPQNSKNLELYSMPVCSEIDVDLDGVEDLLISPFDPSSIVAENTHSVWYYHNDGTNEKPVYTFVQDNYLQENMLDFGTDAYPVFFDYNGDGKEDLFVGNWGEYLYSFYESGFLKSKYYSRLRYFENIGEKDAPAFLETNTNFAGLSSKGYRGLFPALGDIDNDNRLELILGDLEGKLILFKKSLSGDSWDLMDENYLDIDTDKHAAPVLYDLDGDKDLDLFVGGKNGKIIALENNSGKFNIITETLGQIDLLDPSISYFANTRPSFYKDPSTGIVYLFIGGAEGELQAYECNPSDWTTVYQQKSIEDIIPDFKDYQYGGKNISPAAYSYANSLKLIVGNQSGGLFFIGESNTPDIDIPVEEVEEGIKGISVKQNQQHLELSKTNRNSCQVRLYDVRGGLRYQIKWDSKSLSIPMQNIPKELMILYVTDDEGRSYKKKLFL